MRDDPAAVLENDQPSVRMFEPSDAATVQALNLRNAGVYRSGGVLL